MTLSEWFTKNKVLIIGLLSAIVMPIYDLIKQGHTSTNTVILTAAIAITAYFARNLRGQWQTIFGILATVVANYAVQAGTGQPIKWWELILGGIALFLSASAPPAKSVGYEKTPVIVEAKKAGEEIAPTPVPPAK